MSNLSTDLVNLPQQLREQAEGVRINSKFLMELTRKRQLLAAVGLMNQAADRLEQMELPVREVMKLAEGEDGAEAMAYINALHKRAEGHRKHIATLEARCRELKAAYDGMFDKAAQLERKLANG